MTLIKKKNHIFGFYKVLFCVAVLLPYVSLGIRFPSQIQPWAAVLGWIGIILLVIKEKKIALDRYELAILFLSLVMCGYILDPDNIDWSAYLKRSIGLFFSIGVYLFGRSISPNHLKTALLIALAAYFLVGSIQLVSPSHYQTIASVLIPEKNITELGYSQGGERGVESLTAEATDFGFTACFLLVFGIFTSSGKANLSSKLSANWSRLLIIGMSIACMLLSQSASAAITIVAILLVLLPLQFASPAKATLVTLGIITVTSVFLASGYSEKLMEVRGVKIVGQLLTEPMTVLSKSSFVHRYVHTAVGFCALYDSCGTGFGAGTFTNHSVDVYDRYGVGNALDLTSHHKTSIPELLEIAPIGVISMLMLEYGVLGVAFICLPFLIWFKSNVRYPYVVLILLALCWAQSFPIAYPPFWLLLAMCKNPRFATTSLQLSLGDPQ